MRIKIAIMGFVLAGLLAVIGAGTVLAGGQAPQERGASFARFSDGTGRGLAGEVTAVDGTTITVNTREGARTVGLSANTTVREGRAVADRGAITVGDRVKVQGQADARGTIAAERISIGDDCRRPDATPGATTRDGV